MSIITKQYLELLLQLTKRDVFGKYKGSTIGGMWLVVTPIVMLAIYTFVFSIVFKMRWGSNEENIGYFALNIMTGMVIFSLFSEVVVRCSSVVRDHASYVKRIVFPLKLLPVVILLSAGFNTVVATLVFAFGYFLVLGVPDPSVLSLLILVIPFFILVLGIGLIVATFGVFFPDIKHISGTLMTMLMFMTPVFYSMELVPEDLHLLININPLVYYVEESRSILFQNGSLNIHSYLIQMIKATSIFLFGLYVFSKLNKYFADVI